jgi:hypothetical protein
MIDEYLNDGIYRTSTDEGKGLAFWAPCSAHFEGTGPGCWWMLHPDYGNLPRWRVQHGANREAALVFEELPPVEGLFDTILDWVERCHEYEAFGMEVEP